jgi:SAM-dependent methyltransferase
MTMENLRKVGEGLAASAKATIRKMSGHKSSYEIAPGYYHRAAGMYFDDTNSTDGWQKEVYEAARDIMRANKLCTIYDVGCGSAHKLIHILGEYDTIGIDLPETLDVVIARYPDRKWLSTSFDNVNLPKVDLVMCCDVIEHVDDPDALMRFIVNCAKDWIVISTPDRDLLSRYRRINKFYYGPPSNPSHIREWTMPEFGRYVGRFVQIERHAIINRLQGTQMIVARIQHNLNGDSPYVKQGVHRAAVA